MKQIAFILFFVMAQHMTAQSDFLHIDKALHLSSQEGKPIMLVFSGSDWCKPCIQLKKKILETEAFTIASEELIMLYLDFPYKRANQLTKEETIHNESLAEQYNKSGHFPKIVFLNQNGIAFAELIYEKGMTADNCINQIIKIIKTYEYDKS